jgi:hypothetical protein
MDSSSFDTKPSEQKRVVVGAGTEVNDKNVL